MSVERRIVFPRRYSLVPWLGDADLRAQGDPETTIEHCGGTEITHGLRIERPFGPETDATLLVHATRETGEITLAIDHILKLDHQPVRTWQPYMDTMQSASPRAKRVWPLENDANEPDED